MEGTLPVISDLTVIFFDLLIYTRMISLRKKDALHRFFMYFGCAIILAAYFTVTYALKKPAALTSALCMSIPSFLLFWWLSQYRDSRFLLTFCFVDSLSLIVAFLGRYVGILAGSTGGLLSLIVTVLIFIAIVACGWRAFQRYHALLAVAEDGWRSMAVASVLIYFALVFTAAYPKPLIERVEYAPIYLCLSAVVLSCYVVFVSSVLKTKQICEQNAKLSREAEIYRIAYTDSLTGLGNRAAYVEAINAVEREGAAQGVCCVILDVDQFKAVNDAHGHHMGDRALQGVTAALNRTFSQQAQRIFRIGGDEFALILRGVSAQDAGTGLDALAREVAAEGRGLGVDLSVSTGCAFLGEVVNDSMEKAFIRADQRMYQNKKKDPA